MPLIFLAVASYAAGLLAGFGGAVLPGAVVACGAALGCALTRRGAAAAVALVALAGVLVADAARREERRCAERSRAVAVWRVRVDEAAAPGAFVSGRSVGRCAVRVSLAVERGRAAAGATVEARGAVTATRRGVLVQRATIVPVARPAVLERVRSAAGEAIESAFRGDAPLAKALLIADTRSLAPGLRDRYAAAGLVHMLSISGLHVGLIASAALLLFRACRLGRRRATLAAVALTGVYVAIIGAPAPALRAAVMLAVGAAASLGQRPTSPWAALALGALAPLVDPRAVLDVGLQLSVAGMAALTASAALTRRWIAPRLGGWRREVAAALLTSVVASAVTAPLVAWSFGRVSLVAPLANLVAAPVMALAQPTLFLGLLLAPLPAAARFVGDAAHPMLAAFDGVARLAASLPGATVDVAPTAIAAVVGGAAAVAALVACVSAFPGRALLVGAACLAALAWLPALPAGSGRTELHVIDVGQGDAIALRTARGRWVLFDAGRAWAGGDAGRATVVPYLRRRGGELAAFVLSHPHTDHVGGAATILRSLRPHDYFDAAFAGGAEAYARSLGAARDAGVAWHRVRPGDSLVVDEAVISFLAPDSAWTVSLRDPNEASTVALVRAGAVRFLLVGDAERAEESWLLARSAAAGALRADVLKVGHHGSSTSSTAPFLDAVRPRVAVVSVGAGNRYGHPSASVMHALAARGAEVLRTDRLGSIVVRTDGRALEVDADGDQWTPSPPSPAP